MYEFKQYVRSVDKHSKRILYYLNCGTVGNILVTKDNENIIKDKIKRFGIITEENNYKKVFSI